MLSRVAQNIYWMTRYVERAEDTARLINVNANLLLDLPRNTTFGWLPLIFIVGAEQQFFEKDPNRLTDEASLTLDPARRMALFVEADRIAMQDVAFIPIMYGAHRALVHTWVTGFEGNALNVHLSRFIGLER